MNGIENICTGMSRVVATAPFLVYDTTYDNIDQIYEEGFELTVSEAMWKGKPVIPGAVGGIPLQIAHKYSGIPTRSVQGTAHAIRQLINEPEYARTLGKRAKEHIRNNFLITRHIKDYLLLSPSAVNGMSKDAVEFQEGRERGFAPCLLKWREPAPPRSSARAWIPAQ
jgi:hypothetical protein